MAIGVETKKGSKARDSRYPNKNGRLNTTADIESQISWSVAQKHSALKKT
jgi:hypothetical protein